MMADAVGEIAEDAGAQQADGQARRGVLECASDRENASTMSVKADMTMNMPFLSVNELNAAPVLPQWTRLKNPGMTGYSPVSKAMLRMTSHLVT